MEGIYECSIGWMVKTRRESEIEVVEMWRCWSSERRKSSKDYGLNGNRLHLGAGRNASH